LAASKLARDEKDWLYYAYTQSMLGKLHQKQQRYDKAYALFSSALVYQELLNCPLGITQGHVDFAQYYLSKGDKEQAKQSAAKAKALVEEKNLSKARPLLKYLEESM
jgi:nucleoid-associated protein YejK